MNTQGELQIHELLKNLRPEMNPMELAVYTDNILYAARLHDEETKTERTVYMSAETGKFVSKDFALANPATTYSTKVSS